MSSKFTVDFWISARLTLLQALITVAIFMLFTVERTLSFRMKAAMALKIHSDSSLLKKPLRVKFTSYEPLPIEHSATFELAASRGLPPVDIPLELRDIIR